MQVKKLYISDFKNLRNFTIEFDSNSFTGVIVGQNGTGKSNLLEALVVIFSDLDLGLAPQFAYELHYTCHGHNILIVADPTKQKLGDKVKVLIDGAEISYARFKREGSGNYLPNFVFGYYSGPSNRLEQHFAKHQEKFYKDLLNGVEKPLRRLFYARPIHSQFVLLSFFTNDDPEVLDFLRTELHIEDLDSILFVMHEPDWNSSEGDPRFWYARGVVERFLDRLYKLALAPIRRSLSAPIDFKKKKTREYLYLYLSSKEVLRELANGYSSQQEFFKALESTYISKLISEVRIRVKIRNSDDSLTFRELSEGEQQLLMVLGLLRFTKEDESLFLLDEPDTHLNPTWSVYYLDFLKRIVGSQPNSQILMTTHNPLVLSELERSDVRILEMNEETGAIRVVPPEQSPIKLGYAEILTSDIFKLRATINPKIQQLLNDKRELASKDILTDDERIQLHELNQELEDYDFTSAVRDPLYQPFVKAMAEAERHEELQSPILTAEQQKRRRELALQILQDLKLQTEP